MKKHAVNVKRLVSFLMICIMLTTLSFAHSGRTDSSGGHKDNKNVSGLGYYHYHHGMGPHLHPNGICPYDSVQTVSPPAPKATPAPATIPVPIPTPTPSAVLEKINVTINGVAVPMTDSAPFIENGRTYVPVRAVLEAFGVDSIGYEAPNVLVSRGSDKLRIPVGQNCIMKNEKSISTDAAAMIRNGRTCLPIRSVIEALGGTVGWDANTKTVLITKPAGASVAPVVTTGKLNINFIDVGQGDAIF